MLNRNYLKTILSPQKNKIDKNKFKKALISSRCSKYYRELKFCSKNFKI